MHVNLKYPNSFARMSGTCNTLLQKIYHMLLKFKCIVFQRCNNPSVFLRVSCVTVVHFILQSWFSGQQHLHSTEHLCSVLSTHMMQHTNTFLSRLADLILSPGLCRCCIHMHKIIKPIQRHRILTYIVIIERGAQ